MEAAQRAPRISPLIVHELGVAIALERDLRGSLITLPDRFTGMTGSAPFSAANLDSLAPSAMILGTSSPPANRARCAAAPSKTLLLPPPGRKEARTLFPPHCGR